ncbi:MAG: hypothetical protein EOM68_25460 [Spirochaetia bacterium]|nr:hypothetical protein [Spirochaetia bacterium]
MSITEMVDSYREEGCSDEEINRMVLRDLADQEEDRIEAYENDPMVQAGWAQQDLIDSYRYER